MGLLEDYPKELNYIKKACEFYTMYQIQDYLVNNSYSVDLEIVKKIIDTLTFYDNNLKVFLLETINNIIRRNNSMRDYEIRKELQKNIDYKVAKAIENKIKKFLFSKSKKKKKLIRI